MESVENNLKNQYPLRDIKAAKKSFITTDGTIASQAGEDAHYNFFNKNNAEMNKYLENGGIRINYSSLNGKEPYVAIEINNTPTADQVKTLESLPSDVRYVFDIRGKGKTVSSDIMDESKNNFLRTLNEYYPQSSTPQPPTPNAGLGDMGEATPEKTGFFKEVLEEIKKNPQRGAIDFNTRVGLKDKRDLIAVHNLSLSGIKKARNMGGIPVPSIAITKEDIPLEDFGEISLIGGSRFARDDIFTADAYTKRVPQQKFKLNSQEVDRLTAELNPYLQKTGEYKYGRMKSALSEEGTASPKELLYAGNNSNAAKAMYLKEVKGIDIGNTDKEKDISKDLLNGALGLYTRSLSESETVKKLITSGKYKDIESVAWQDETDNPEKFKKAAALAKEIYDDAYKGMVEKYKKSGIGDPEEMAADSTQHLKDYWFTDGKFNATQFDNFVMHMRDYAKEGLVEPDTAKIEEIIKNHFSKVDKKQYENWLSERFGSAYGRSFFYDNAGRSKNYSLENLIEHMTGRVRGAENFFYGAGSVKAKISKKLYGVEEVAKHKDLLQPKEVTEKVHEELQDELFDLLGRIKSDSEWSKSESFSIKDQIGKDIASVGTNITKTRVKGALYRAGVSDPDDDLIDDTYNYLVKLKNSPVSYFESKPQRAVQLNEFEGAVVPEDMLEEFKEYAGDTVKRIITYNPKKSGDRANAIKKFRDVMFSVAGIGVATQGMTVDEATAKKE